MGITYKFLRSRTATRVGYLACFYLCHVAAVTIPTRIAEVVLTKAEYVAEGLVESSFRNSFGNFSPSNRRELLPELIAKYCKTKGGCLEEKLPLH